METNVGNLRQRSARCDANEPVIVVTDDEKLERLLNGCKMRVVEFYPSTTFGDGKPSSTFKIKIALE